MKRLFPVFALAALIAMSLVSCKQNEVKLHEQVGAIYDPASATKTMGGDGIVFYVDEDGGYALVCSMNDLKYDRQASQSGRHMWVSNFTWSVFGTDTVMEKDTVWGKVTRSIRQFTGREEYDSLVGERNEHFLRYNFGEEKDTLMTIYPMLRYKAYKENGQPVLEPFTKDTAYNGFVGELLPADSVIRAINMTEKVIWDTIYVTRDTIRNGDSVRIEIQRDTINPRDTVIYDTLYSVVAARYADTLWNNVKRGDRRVMISTAAGPAWDCELDTNWSFSHIGIGEDDPDGFVNTQKIVNADVPCRQRITPDSSSAARTCREYYTKSYNDNRAINSADTAFKAATYAEENESMRWYLPSRDELRKLFDARNRINEMNANTLGFEPLQNCYWSSNERDAKNAWYKCFSDNGVESYIPKANNSYRVNIRAVRKVKWPLQ